MRTFPQPGAEARGQVRHGFGAGDAQVAEAEMAGAGLEEAAQVGPGMGPAGGQKSRSA
ncbi:hypothetical protein MPOCJGCO_0941 [Methylobacterium trifolii]|uniref:Uncharacterized protein n=1 Tax=Methylobacterium trifolii TaxID=1003092 RepID=A0ABQ4TUW8_9HYPH|nr:hypothetical protein MPOCJGCO_0941 [Methylobacterium trifolii]